jgi:glucose-6-phosphate-specific signal transduction histidine kinase
MFVLRSTLDSTVAVYNGEVLHLRQELAEERTRIRELATLLAKAVDATEAERATLAEVARNMHQALGQGVEAARALLDKELAAMRMELAVERGKREVLSVQLRISQNNADWLRG